MRIKLKQGLGRFTRIKLVRIASQCGGLDTKAEVGGNIVDDLRAYAAHLPRIGRDQRIFTDRVDQSRQSIGMLIHGSDSLRWKQNRWIRASRQLQPALDVTLGLIRIQRHEVGAQSDSLFQLPQADRVELLVQLRLSDQQNLQQLLLWRLQVAQQSDLFKNFCREMVRFVDY